MLPSAHRLTDPASFRDAVRRGRRAGSARLVLHLTTPRDVAPIDEAAPPRVGLVVSRGVGGAVVRTQVKRRLRHLLRERLGSLPAGAVLVVRALPPAATAPYAVLGVDLDAGLRRCLREPVGAA